jgi:hypothetical protein
MRMVVVLPAPLGADHTQAFAGLDVKGHIVDHGGLAITLDQTVD